MQTLKEEVRVAIEAAAIAEFMEKGYRDASMRNIARGAGITAGNIYRYFIGKDSLFNAIMEPVSRQIIDLVYADQMQEGAQSGEVLDIDTIMGSIMKLCAAHAKEMLILLYKSEGSKFEGIRRRLIDMVAVRIAGLLPGLSSDTPHSPVMAGALAAGIVEGVFEILQNSMNDNVAIEDAIRRLILFFFRDLYGT